MKSAVGSKALQDLAAAQRLGTATVESPPASGVEICAAPFALPCICALCRLDDESVDALMTGNGHDSQEVPAAPAKHWPHRSSPLLPLCGDKTGASFAHTTSVKSEVTCGKCQEKLQSKPRRRKAR